MSRGEVDCIVTGADRIAANGDSANKIGTYGLAVAAAHHRIPLYVVAPTSTIDPATATGAGIPIEERDGAEITARFEAHNPAFDVTPAQLIAAIVTEDGVHRPPYESRCRDERARRARARSRPTDPDSIGLILHGSRAAGVDRAGLGLRPHSRRHRRELRGLAVAGEELTRAASGTSQGRYQLRLARAAAAPRRRDGRQHADARQRPRSSPTRTTAVASLVEAIADERRRAAHGMSSTTSTTII